MARSVRLNSAEIQLAFDDEAARAMYPPILSPAQFGKLFGISRSIYTWIDKGHLKGAVAKFGKHRFIWRNRAIEIIFNRNQPKDDINDDNGN